MWNSQDSCFFIVNHRKETPTLEFVLIVKETILFIIVVKIARQTLSSGSIVIDRYRDHCTGRDTLDSV